jgi:hypothetical protein
MTRFDRNQTALIEKKIREKVLLPKIGLVEQVFEHSAEDDDSNWEVDVRVDTFKQKTKKLNRVPVHTPGSDIITPPKRGDKVLIIYTDGQTKRPIAFGAGWSNEDRPPQGRAGIYRNRFEASDKPSPLGTGDLFFTGYTKYDNSPASRNKRYLNAEETFIQLTKHENGDNFDPTRAGELPAKIELYDSAEKDEAHIHLNANSVDQDANLGLDVFMNLKSGKLHVRAENDNDGETYEFVLDVMNEFAKIIGDSDSGNKMGASFNFDTDEFKIADGKKFGIKSDGDGNFTWSRKSLTITDNNTATEGSINL